LSFSEKKILGRTNLLVSRLGLASGYGISAKGVERAFHEYGINYFYWSSPRRGRMREGLINLAKSNRDKIFIALQSYDHIGITVNRAVEKGLKALSIDYADVLILGWHNWNPPKYLIKKALKLKESGKIRFIAMSGHNREFFGKIAMQNNSPMDIFMLRYNAAHRGAEKEIFPHLSKDNRPGITAYTATRWGKLLNQKKMPKGEKPLTASDCYRFVLSNSNIDLCMMGPRNEKEMEEGLKTLKQGPLTDQEMDRIRKIGDYVHG